MTQKHKHSIRCQVCGLRRRGKNHDEGEHHKDVENNRREKRVR